jgi:hypothetical protein
MTAVGTFTLLIALGSGCATGPAFRRQTREERRSSLLTERAAFDLQCAKGQLRIQQLGNDQTQGVTGCGRRAVYLYDYGRDAWVMNGAIDSDQPAASRATDTANPPSSARREDASGNPGGTTP